MKFKVLEGQTKSKELEEKLEETGLLSVLKRHWCHSYFGITLTLWDVSATQPDVLQILTASSDFFPLSSKIATQVITSHLTLDLAYTELS